MYVYVSVRRYVYRYVYVQPVQVRICTSVYVQVCVYVCVGVYVQVCIYRCLYIGVCMHGRGVHIHTYLHTYTHPCISNCVVCAHACMIVRTNVPVFRAAHKLSNDYEIGLFIGQRGLSGAHHATISTTSFQVPNKQLILI